MIDVVNYIKAHKGVPVSSRKLAEAFRVDTIDIRRVINTARTWGYPICSNSKGYYYSEDKEEVKKTIKSLTHRIEGIQKAINGLTDYVGGVYEV